MGFWAEVKVRVRVRVGFMETLCFTELCFPLNHYKIFQTTKLHSFYSIKLPGSVFQFSVEHVCT